MNKVEAQDGKALDPDAAEYLLQVAEDVVYELTAPPCVCYGQAPEFTWMIDNLSDLVASSASCEIVTSSRWDVTWLQAYVGEEGPWGPEYFMFAGVEDGIGCYVSGPGFSEYTETSIEEAYRCLDYVEGELAALGVACPRRTF